MLDATDLMPAVSADQHICPKCEVEFSPKRKNQRYCSRSCQAHANRGSRAAADSIETAEQNRKHYDRAAWLCHDIYCLPVDQRLQFMADLIEAARGYDGQLRGILTDPKLLGASPLSDVGKLGHHRKDRSVKNIAKAAYAYCRRFWGSSVADVVHKRAPVPPSGEVGDVRGHSPMEAIIRTRTYRGTPSGNPRVKPEGWDYRSLLSSTLRRERTHNPHPHL